MKLFYFTKQTYALEAIRDRRLKIARIAELNDPFELVAPQMAGEHRRIFNSIKTKINQRAGILCFTSEWNHPLMWSHYADAYKGICLGFEVASSTVNPISYLEKRPKLEEWGIDSLKDWNMDAAKRVLYSKFSAWKYESEYRAYLQLDHNDTDLVSGLYFLPFSDQLKLTEVVVGPRAALNVKRLREYFEKNKNDIKVKQARPAFQEFCVVENKRFGG